LPPTGPLPVLVGHRGEAEAALARAAELGIEIKLVMAAGVLGPAAIKALETLLDRPITVLCDDRPGLALEALRAGLRQLVLEPEAAAPGDEAAYLAAAARLADIARQSGGTLRLGLARPLHALSPDGRRFAPLRSPGALGSGASSVP
jgi:hypothetical protein